MAPTCRRVLHSRGWSRSCPCTGAAACWSTDSLAGSSGSTKACWRRSWSPPTPSWWSPAPRTSSPWRSRTSRSASPASSPPLWAAPAQGPAAGIFRLKGWCEVSKLEILNISPSTVLLDIALEPGTDGPLSSLDLENCSFDTPRLSMYIPGSHEADWSLGIQSSSLFVFWFSPENNKNWNRSNTANCGVIYTVGVIAYQIPQLNHFLSCGLCCLKQSKEIIYEGNMWIMD